MARPEKINLRAFQQELSERLKHKTAAQVDSLRLALESGGISWLVRLGDTGEVLPMIGDVLDLLPAERDAGTVACITAGFLRGAQIFRVHNVRAAVQSLRMLEAVEKESAASPKTGGA